ncbi:MAG TPA: HAD family hydrolase [Sandaracinaceae bacterium]
MQYRALVADYDGTLAEDGRVSDAVLDAIARLRAAGAFFVVATGRELEDLLEVFPQAATVCDRIVAENGALLVRPASRVVRMLTRAADPRLVAMLRMRKVAPLSVGRAIVATHGAHERAVRDAIRGLGIAATVSRNLGAVMVLPRGVDKGSGARAALDELGVAPADAVAIGDAENDEALLRACGCAVATANALARTKRRADLVTEGAAGAGVVELIGRFLADDLPAARARGRKRASSG